jgi:hypothetical protein
VAHSNLQVLTCTTKYSLNSYSACLIPVDTLRFAALPALMRFANRPESLFFYGQVTLAMLVIGMTDFNVTAGDDRDPTGSDPFKLV